MTPGRRTLRGISMPFLGLYPELQILPGASIPSLVRTPDSQTRQGPSIPQWERKYWDKIHLAEAIPLLGRMLVRQTRPGLEMSLSEAPQAIQILQDRSIR